MNTVVAILLLSVFPLILWRQRVRERDLGLPSSSAGFRDGCVFVIGEIALIAHSVWVLIWWTAWDLWRLLTCA